MTTIARFWNTFIEAKQLDKQISYLEAFHFDCTKESANALLQLVLDEKKRATCSSLRHYEISGERKPQVGDYSIVCDFDDKPYCVIKTTQVLELPFCDMTYAICKREGEDACLETWIEKHVRFFQDDAQQCGYPFTRDMPIVFEDFEVVYRR